MNKYRFLSISNSPNGGALQIAGLYLLIGGLWILFSDRVAARIALNEQMLTTISVYKGWGYVLVTAILLYWLIQRHTATLRASEVQLHQVIDAMPAFISYVGADRHYRFTNKTYQEWYDERPEGKHIEEVIGKAAYQRVSKYIDQVLTGETVSYETEIPYQDTELFMDVKYIPDIAADGQVKGFFVMAQDQTTQRQAEEEQRLWADAFEGCYHGIAIGDPHTNRIVVCNPAFAGMLKRSVDEVVGSAILSLFAPSDTEHVRRQIEKADQIGYVRYEAHMTRGGKDGSFFPVQIDVVSVLDDDGDLLHRVVTAQDISERKSIDEKLKESETKYRTLVEHLPAITYISEPDAYVGVSYISPQIESLGFDRNAWLADPELWFRQIHPEDQERVTAELQEFEAGAESFKAEYRLILPNGEVRWFHDESIRIKDQSGRTILKQGFMLDITESKQAEEESKSLARFPDENPNPVLRATNEGKIIYANAASGPLLKDWQSKVAGYLPTDLKNVIRELIQTSSRKTIDIQCGDTTYSIMVVPVPDANYVNLYGRDVTERKQAEERFATAFHSSPTPIALTRLADGKIMDVNEAFCQLFGYSHEEIVGRTSLEVGIADPESRQKAVKELKEKGVIRNLEQKARDRSGRQLYILNSVESINVNGEPYALTTLIDITERKQGEEYLRRFELLSEHSRDVILFMRREDGHILEANAAAVKAYGYSREELLSLTIQDLRASDTLGLTAAQMAQADTGGILFETTHRRRDGSTFPVEVSSQGATISGVRMLISIVRDITERKQTEDALRQSEQRLNRAQEIAHLGSWELDLINNRLTWSDEVYRIFGLHPQEFGATYEAFLEVVHPDDRAAVDYAYSSSIREGRDTYEIEHRIVKRSSGEVRIVHEKCEHFRSQGGQIIRSVGMVHDITERKRAEDALRLKDELLHLTSEIAKVGGWEFDAETGKGTWTDEVARIHDLDPAQETNVEIGLSFYQGESRENVEQAVKEAIERAKPYDLELEMVTVKGNHKWVRTIALPIVQDGKVVKVQGIFQDITERKQIEKALQTAHDELELKVQERTAALSESNALLQAMMDHMPDQIYFKDMQGRFIRNSRSQANLLGLNDSAQAIGKSDFDFFPHASRAYAEEQEIMRSGKPLVDLEEWVVWPDGREMWVSTTKVPLRNANEETIGIFGISHDITERKQAEQAIRQLNVDLEKQAEQLKAANKELEAFSYSVSHDLRAPLRAIDGYTRILVEDYESLLDEEGKRICSVISKEARRMGQLIDDLLAFSRLGRKEMHTSKIDMRALAVSVLNDLLKAADRERIDFQIARLPSVRGDSALIRQVWANLLANAIKFTSRKERAVIEVGSKTNPEELIYYVRDTGAGFDMEYANKLFGVFQRLHGESEFDGTGVGLAIVQRIIHRHEGRVWAEGEVEKGATFYFALPRKEHHHE